MSASRTCSSCGAELPPGWAPELCAACLGRGNSPTERVTSSGSEQRDQPTSQAPERFRTVAIPYVPSPSGEKPGDLVGRYKLLQEIAKGGMGTVWMAEQQEPVHRRVALKVIILGMDTQEVVARFEAERQALALMNHPNIAKALDAGATERGRPFFVMEYVAGEPINRFCDKQRLNIPERLNLFIQICQAVQHAHQKGIIHRDLKPSNILVSYGDAGSAPVPKIIDFGIAKATAGQRLTDKTLVTQFEQFVGTPDYVSPEQAEMTGADIDTRSDIYSLGVLLCELLTGRRPFGDVLSNTSSVDTIRRIIREEDPTPPSALLGALTAQEQAIEADERRTDQRKLVGLIEGDIDWIVMKCLEKDRSRRYEAANALALDVEHHLRGQPVTAAAPSALYRFQKFARRHRGALAVSITFAATLLIGTVVSTWQAVRATRVEKLATSEAHVLKEMFQGIGPSIAMGRDTALLREILEEALRAIGTELKEQPRAQAELESTMAENYSELGEYEKAAALSRTAIERLKKLSGSKQSELQARNDLAQVLNKQGKTAEAETIHREVLVLRRRLLGPEHEDVAESLNNLAEVLWGDGKLSEADALYRQALAIRRKRYGAEHPRIYESLNNIAQLLDDQGKLDEAVAMFTDALAMERKLLGNEHTDIAATLCNLAGVLAEQKKMAQAETTYREALGLQQKLFGKEHPAVATSLHNLAILFLDQKRFNEAESLERTALSMRTKLLGEEHPQTAESLNGLALLLHQQGKSAEAEAFARQSLAIREKIAPDDWRTFNTRGRLGDYLMAQRKYVEAEHFLLSGYEGMKQRESLIPAEYKQFLSDIAQRLIQLYEATSQPGKAAEWRAKSANPNRPGTKPPERGNEK